MKKKVWLPLLLACVLLLSACGGNGGKSDDPPASSGDSSGSSSAGNSTALTWNTYAGYSRLKPFFELLSKTYPEVEIEITSYRGGNATGYTWAQMRADDITDIYLTSQILDEDLAAERLVDLSGYDFINNLSTALLDQVSIDGGVYLLPVCNSMYGILYNKTLMEEMGWEVPTNFAELEALCAEIEEAGLMPGVIGTQLTGNLFSAVFNLAKTDWFTTPEGTAWERDFLAGNATAAGRWEGTMEYVQKYLDIGMFHADPEDRGNTTVFEEYLGEHKAVFCTMANAAGKATLENGDELGLMPYIGEDGSKNIYMYNPVWYFGISKRLEEPGNEEKLENAIKILSLMFSEEGQTAIKGDSASSMSVLDNAGVSEDALIYDAYHAMREGRAFPMTYAHWDGVLADMGQAYKEWVRGEDGVDGEQCIARMDQLQRDHLALAGSADVCDSTGNFTLEETASLVGQALGRAADVDAVLVPLGEFHDGVDLSAGVNGKLYQGYIDADVYATICPGLQGEYAVMTMTGAQVKEVVQTGLIIEGDESGIPFPYVLVTKGGVELEDGASYQVAFLKAGYTEEMAETYSAEVREGSIRTYLHDYLAELKTVSPGENYWK